MANRKPRLVVLPPQHLGHEIHVGRCIVVDMVSKHILEQSSGDVIMTGLSDRRFLYESLLGADQVVDFSVISELKKPLNPPKNTSDYIILPSSFFAKLDQYRDYQIINLSNYAMPSTYCTYETSEEMLSVGYTVPDQYLDRKFLETAKKFKYLSAEEIGNTIPSQLPLFIVIHNRYDANYEKLKCILDALPAELTKVIFTSNMNALKVQLNNRSDLYFTDNLKIYSSLLNDSRCKLLITEWSGAGQIAQYTLGPQGSIWFYYDHYRDPFNFSMTHKVWEHNAKIGSYFNCWDFKNISGCATAHFASFNNLIDNCKNIRIAYGNPPLLQGSQK